MINWKNTVENLIIVIAIMSITSYVTHKATLASALKTNEATISAFIPTIEKAIDKETIKNEIKNDIDLKIDKIKKSDSLNILINQKPNNNQKPTNNLTKNSCPEGSVCVPIKNLTRRQKRRLGSLK